MSMTNYNNAATDALTRLVNDSVAKDTDDIIIELQQTIEKLGKDFASIR